MSKTKKSVAVNEGTEAFARRVQTAINGIRHVSKHGGRNYQPTAAMVTKAMDAIRAELEITEQRLEAAYKGLEVKRVKESFRF